MAVDERWITLVALFFILFGAVEVYLSWTEGRTVRVFFTAVLVVFGTGYLFSAVNQRT